MGAVQTKEDEWVQSRLRRMSGCSPDYVLVVSQRALSASLWLCRHLGNHRKLTTQVRIIHTDK